jgi:adenylyl-sulfate kinase
LKLHEVASPPQLSIDIYHQKPAGDGTRLPAYPVTGLNLKGATVWFTGLPSSGKSTIAREVYQRLIDRGCAVELLDGAEVRESLSRGLGFSREDREENVRRIGYVAKLLSRNGVIAICAAVSPYRASRDEVRRNSTGFVEVYVECPVEVAESRDADGWYARARRGEVEEFTGVNAPYEPPLAPEVHLHADRETVDAAAWKVMRTLEVLGVISAEDVEERSSQEEEIRRRLASLGYL